MWVFLVASLQAENATVFKQLANRDGPPDCSSLAVQTADIKAQLSELIEADAKPSYVPMRAANCLLELYPSDVETYVKWMSKPEYRGLAFLVIGKIDSLPIDVGVTLARAGLEAVHSEEIATRLQKVEVPEIQQVLLRSLDSENP
jgi:hypothetical protein